MTRPIWLDVLLLGFIGCGATLCLLLTVFLLWMAFA